MHHLANLAALHDQGCLHTLAHLDEIVVDGTDGKERRNGHVVLVDVAVGEDDVVEPVVDALLRVVAELVESLAQRLARMLRTLRRRHEADAELAGVEALVANVLQDVELAVGKYGVGQAHHLAVGLVGVENARAHATDIFGQAHHELLAYGVDGRVGDLGELLAEIVEEDLWLVRQHGERRVVAH